MNIYAKIQPFYNFTQLYSNRGQKSVIVNATQVTKYYVMLV